MRRSALLLLAAVSLPHAASAGKPKEQCGPLEMAAVVRVLAEYDVLHVAMPPVRACGATHITGGVTDSNRKHILLNNDLIEAVARLATLHELHHADMFRRGLSSEKHDEQAVRRCAIRSYKSIFGGEMDLPERFREAALEER